jgi:arylsulfatase A-like enzyme
MDMPARTRTAITTTTTPDDSNNNLRHLTSGNNNNNNTKITTTKSVFDQIMSLASGWKRLPVEVDEEDDDEMYDPNTTEPMNVVLFYADDWTMKVLGKFDSRIKTPNIDRLADKGMLFANNCVTTSICWMSRATLATGTYVSQHQQLMPFIDQMFYSFNWTQTLYPLLKNNGYFTGLVGKWHGGMPNDKLNEAFHLRRFYYGFHYEDHNISKRHITDLNREHALDFLEEYTQKHSQKYKHFFLKVSFFATHAIDGHLPSYMPMNWSRTQYYPDSTYVEPPKTASEEYNRRLPPFLSGNSNEGRTRWKKRFEPDYFQSNIKDLYSMATEVDWAIGEVMKSLEDKGFTNNTMIIFTTDNGNLAGEHGTYKQHA